MFTWIWVFLLYSWKIEFFISKIRISKVTDYAALKEAICFFFKLDQGITVFIKLILGMITSILRLQFRSLGNITLSPVCDCSVASSIQNKLL